MSILPTFVTDPERWIWSTDRQFFLAGMFFLVWDKDREVLLLKRVWAGEENEPQDGSKSTKEIIHQEDFEMIAKHIRASYEKIDSFELAKINAEEKAEEKAANEFAKQQNPLRAKPLVATSPESKPIDPPAHKIKDHLGYVYLLASDRGECKIGKAKEVHKRIAQLSIQLPYKVSLVHSFPAKDYHRAESALHQKFASKRANGEWFQLDDADIAWIKSITDM